MENRKLIVFGVTCLIIIISIVGRRLFFAKRYNSIQEAVFYEDQRATERMIQEGYDINVTDEKGQTALILAAKTDQFKIAEELIDAGADIFQVSDFGWTVGYAAETSTISDLHPQSGARKRVLEKIKVQGFPFPAPKPTEVREMIKKGEWPFRINR